MYFTKLRKYFCTLLEGLTRFCDFRQTDYWVRLWNGFAPCMSYLNTRVKCGLFFLFSLLLWWHGSEDIYTGKLWLSNGGDYITFHSSLCVLARSQGWQILANRLLSPIPHVTGSLWHVTDVCCDITYVWHRSVYFETDKCVYRQCKNRFCPRFSPEMPAQ